MVTLVYTTYTHTHIHTHAHAQFAEEMVTLVYTTYTYTHTYIHMYTHRLLKKWSRYATQSVPVWTLARLVAEVNVAAVLNI
jgi:hypothetical protein